MPRLSKNEALQRISEAVKMNVFERALATISPGAALKRAQSRAALALSGAYVGGSRARKATQEWVTSGGDADTDLLMDLPTMRERCRDLDRNNPLAHGAIQTKVMRIIGSGLKLRPQLDRKLLGLEDAAADELEETIKREWRLFWMNREVDSSRICSGPELEWMHCKQRKVNGEVLVLFPRIERTGSPYSTKVQLVEADRLYNKDSAADSDELAGGVRKNKQTGEPIEYHILKQHPGKLIGTRKLEWDIIPAFGSKTGLPNVLHNFRMERPGQSRGIPDFSPVIEMLKELGRYSEAEVSAAVLSSFFTVFVRSTDPDNETGLNIKKNSALPGSDSAGNTDEYRLGKGSIVGLGPNEDISTANPGRPNPNFDPFFSAISQQIGVGLGLPAEVLLKKFTASYTAARGALLDAWAYFIMEREFEAMRFNQPIYELFFYEAVALGRIAAPGYFDDSIIRAAYTNADWIGPAKGMINEKDEIAAAKERVALTITTLDEETSAITGGDWEAKFPQRVKESKMVKDAGLDVEANALEQQRLQAEQNQARQEQQNKDNKNQQDQQDQQDTEDEKKREQKQEEQQQESARRDQQHKDLITALVNKEQPAPVVNVAAPVVNVTPAPINVAAPTVNVTPPSVTVESPTVNIAPAQITVTQPDIKVDAHLHVMKSTDKKSMEVRDKNGKLTSTVEMKE